jgi:hypothetical protein
MTEVSGYARESCFFFSELQSQRVEPKIYEIGGEDNPDVIAQHRFQHRFRDMDFWEVAQEATTSANLPDCLEAVARARIYAAQFELWNEQLLTRALQVDVENAEHRERIVACLLEMKAAVSGGPVAYD